MKVENMDGLRIFLILLVITGVRCAKILGRTDTAEGKRILGIVNNFCLQSDPLRLITDKLL